MTPSGSSASTGGSGAIDRLLRLRQHHVSGRRSPHKPLLALLALGRLADTGSSRVTWAEARDQLAPLVAEFGPDSSTSALQRAAYPFTRLRSDGVWTLDRDVPMDSVRPLEAGAVVGQFEAGLEAALRADPGAVTDVARRLVLSQFPIDVAQDVLDAVGIEIELGRSDSDEPGGRRRDPAWRREILRSWDERCAFCGYDGRVGGASVGIEAAHVRWFAFDGPDSLDNGLALCMLHHKLFDRGVLGLDDQQRVRVSQVFSASGDAARAVYALHGRELQPRPGTVMPAPAHVGWHGREVFRGTPLTV